MKVLVTGASGFTGQYVVSVLAEKGMEVCDLGDANLLDSASLAHRIAKLQPDAVIHLAAIAFVAHGDVDELYRTNIVGSRNLFAALANCDKPVEKVLVASSANVYGNAAGGLIDESVPTNPTNDYAVSKRAMELVAGLWQAQLPIIIVRPFNYTGPGQSQSFVIPKLVDHFARRAATIELGNTSVWREYNDVMGVADIYVRLLLGGSAGATFNVCSGRLLSLGDVFEMLTSLTGHKMDIVTNPALVRAGEVHRLGGDPANLTRAIGALHWRATRELLSDMLESRLRELAAS